ncbi:MAG: hypothetical protein ABIT96_09350 [Ferruginibacter sp.]
MISSLNNAFIIPVIALATTVLFYILLLKKTNSPIAFKKIIRIILVFALVLNFLWEMAQMPLFKNMPLNWETTLFCALASIADCIMVLLLYVGFGLMYKNSMWFRQPGVLQVALLIITGGLGAVLAEKKHLFVGNWAYNSYMPIVPVVDVGLLPLLQFMVLPAIIYFVAFYQIRVQQ